MPEPSPANTVDAIVPPGDTTTRSKSSVPHARTLAVVARVVFSAGLMLPACTAGGLETDDGVRSRGNPTALDVGQAPAIDPEHHSRSLPTTAPNQRIPGPRRVQELEAKLVPDNVVDQRAMSVGKPSAGRLIEGVQLPPSPLYIRRSPRAMWGSGQTIASLQQAIASFRRDVEYDGDLVLSDISLKNGGPFSPHVSHQAGREVDIWLPTLEGVLKPEHLGGPGKKPRRPMFEEIDWPATWGLLQALLRAGAVERVFLDWGEQELVVRAALEMGAAPKELDEWFQWPRSRTSTTGIVRHSADHRSHLHVRFKCATWEPSCDRTRVPRSSAHDPPGPQLSPS